MPEEDETGRVAVGGVVPSVADEADDEDVTTLNVQVEFDATAPAPGPRPRLHTIPLPDAQLRSQYPSEANAPVPSAAFPQPPPSVPSVPSLSALDVPNVETRRIDPETLAEVLARNTDRAAWKTSSRPPAAAKAKAPVRWERRIGVALLALAVSMVVLTITRPDLVAQTMTWLEAVVKVAKA